MNRRNFLKTVMSSLAALRLGKDVLPKTQQMGGFVSGDELPMLLDGPYLAVEDRGDIRPRPTSPETMLHIRDDRDLYIKFIVDDKEYFALANAGCWSDNKTPSTKLDIVDSRKDSDD